MMAATAGLQGSSAKRDFCEYRGAGEMPQRTLEVTTWRPAWNPHKALTAAPLLSHLRYQESRYDFIRKIILCLLTFKGWFY